MTTENEKFLSKREKCKYLFEGENIDALALDLEYDLFVDNRKFEKTEIDPEDKQKLEEFSDVTSSHVSFSKYSRKNSLAMKQENDSSIVSFQ